MRKLKIYLDTSVISHLEQPEKITEFGATHEFWERIKQNEFDVFLSSVVFDELKKCDSEKHIKLISYVNEIAYSESLMTSEAEELAKTIISEKILPPKSVEDSRHIAAALTSECQYLLSWNMKHLANTRTNDGIARFVDFKHYRRLSIIPPNMLSKGE
jgi:predicted nucleic acid-binding protein